mgnify:CR=1 FL=1
MGKKSTTYVGPGKLTCGRRTSNAREPFFVLTIEDAASGAGIEVTIEAAELMHALGNAYGQACTIEWGNLAIIGKTHEVKTEAVPCPFQATDAERAAALAPFCVDGWEADPEDLGNPHLSNRNGSFRVNFHRWVSVTPAEPKAKKGKAK